MKVLARLRRDLPVRRARGFKHVIVPYDNERLVHPDHVAAVIAPQYVIPMTCNIHNHSILMGAGVVGFRGWPQSGGVNYGQLAGRPTPAGSSSQ